MTTRMGYTPRVDIISNPSASKVGVISQTVNPKAHDEQRASVAGGERVVAQSGPWLTLEGQAMLRPFETYSLLAKTSTGGLWALLRRPLKWTLIVGAFVSLTTAGRLVWYHVLLSPLLWVYLAVAQIAALAICMRLAPRSARPRFSRLVDDYFVSQGPMYLLTFLVSGLVILSPKVLPVVTWVLDSGLLLALAIFATVWTVVLNLALFQRRLKMSILRSVMAALLFWALYGLAIAGNFWMMDQLQPLMWNNQ